MLPSLSEVLGLPSFRAAGVQVLAGDPAAIEIRWVHSSEVYEMGGLLAGGELLLTTGLGLYGRTAQQLTAYVDLLADAGCAALAMELGRSFFAVPGELERAAEARGLGLLSLSAVVPFERMVEDFHDHLVRRRSAAQRAGEPIWQELLGVLVAGQGVAGLLAAVARLARCGAVLVDPDGRVLAHGGDGTVSGASRTTEVEVSGPGGTLARLILTGGPATRRAAVSERAAVAIALELGRHAPAPAQRPLAGSTVSDLAAGAITSARDIAERLSAAGLPVRAGDTVLAAAIDIDARTAARDLVPAVRDAALGAWGACLVGDVDGHVVVLVGGAPHPPLARVRRRFEEVLSRLGDGGHAAAVRTVGVAMPVTDLADVSAAVAAAREVVRICRRLGVRSGVHLARDVGVERLLIAGSAPDHIAAFVAEQLGALISYDTQQSADLIRTLDAYLRSGRSKSRAAASLGIRRQSLYDRLGRIERMLGVTLDDAAQAQCLGVAMTAWRMRTGVDPQVALDRAGRHAGL